MCLPVSYYLLREMAVASEKVLLSVATTVLCMCPPVFYSTQECCVNSRHLSSVYSCTLCGIMFFLDVRIHGILILKTYRNQISTLFHHFTGFFYTHFFRPSYVKVLFCVAKQELHRHNAAICKHLDEAFDRQLKSQRSILAFGILHCRAAGARTVIWF